MLKKYTLWRRPGLPTLVCAFVCVFVCMCLLCVCVCVFVHTQTSSSEGRREGWDLKKQQNPGKPWLNVIWSSPCLCTASSESTALG